MVWVPEGTDAIHAFTRPLNVKKPSRPALQGIFDFEKNAAQILGNSRTDLIPPTLLKPDNSLSAPPARLILFPRYQKEGDPQIQPLSKAQAGFALLRTLVNARNLPEHGFPQAAHLAQVSRAYQVRYSRFQQIEEPIENLLNR
jgi:hypothetical protein